MQTESRAFTQPRVMGALSSGIKGYVVRAFSPTQPARGLHSKACLVKCSLTRLLRLHLEKRRCAPSSRFRTRLQLRSCTDSFPDVNSRTGVPGSLVGVAFGLM